MLERRRAVGSTWAEGISHVLSGIDELTAWMLLLEIAIADQRPDDVDVWMREWIVANATKSHEPAQRREDCSICVALGRPSAVA